MILNRNASQFAGYDGIVDAAIAAAATNGWANAEPTGQSANLGVIALSAASPSQRPAPGASNDFSPKL